MSGTNAPRYLPTLTEVVSPEVVMQVLQTPAVATAEPPAVAPLAVTPDQTAVITRKVIAKIAPLLEEQLRISALELLEAQVNAVLPTLHHHIEAVVRESIEEALKEAWVQQPGSGPASSPWLPSQDR